MNVCFHSEKSLKYWLSPPMCIALFHCEKRIEYWVNP
uniref:Uncharacterized protein n=1 Tax=Anguilla anguilla TaxID=7936 RepID=A0A0E9RJW9_ANGAN